MKAYVLITRKIPVIMEVNAATLEEAREAVTRQLQITHEIIDASFDEESLRIKEREIYGLCTTSQAIRIL